MAQFEDNLKELKELHSKDSDLVNKRTERLVYDLRKEINIYSNGKYDVKKDLRLNETYDIYACGLIIFAIVVLGITTIGISEQLPLFCFGFIFFIAGLLVSFSKSPMTLIFLFSHGLTGCIIMIASIISSIGISLSHITDISSKGKNYVYLVLTAFIISLISAIYQNVSEYAKTNKNIKIIVLVLFFISFYLLTRIGKYI